MLVVLAMATVALYLQPIAAIMARVPLSYDEGWNAYNAATAIAGGTLYPPSNALTANNYPPLSFYLVGELGRLFGGDIIAGRFVALVSLIIVAINAHLICAAGGTRTGSGFAALLLLTYVGAFYRGYVGIDEPQWLGHALMSGALVMFIWSHGAAVHSGGRKRLAPVLMTAGGFIKINLIALPLAVLTWCSVHERAELRRWLSIGAILTGLALAGCYLAYGPDFLSDVFQPRPYSMVRLLAGSRKALSPLFLLLASGVVLYLTARRKPLVQLVLLWAALGGASGIAFVGGAGVNYNVFFDLLIALCIAGGLLISEVQHHAGWRFAAPLLMLLLALPPLTRVPGRVGAFAAYLNNTATQRREAAQDIAFIAARQGRAACEMLALCYWAGKPYEIDFFNTAQKIAEGLVSPDTLVAGLDQHRYGAIVLTTNPPLEERLPAAVMARLHAEYRPARISPNGWVFLLPAGPGK